MHPSFFIFAMAMSRPQVFECEALYNNGGTYDFKSDYQDQHRRTRGNFQS